MLKPKPKLLLVLLFWGLFELIFKLLKSNPKLFELLKLLLLVFAWFAKIF